MEANLMAWGIKEKDFVGWWPCLKGMPWGCRAGSFALYGPIRCGGAGFWKNESMRTHAWLVVLAGRRDRSVGRSARSNRAFEVFDRFGKHHLRSIGRTCCCAAGRSVDSVAAHNAVSRECAYPLRARDAPDPELLAIVGGSGVAPGDRYGFRAEALDKGHDGAFRGHRWRPCTIGRGAAAYATG